MSLATRQRNTSVLVWTAQSAEMDEEDRYKDRYFYGACDRGLPWQDAAQTMCSGDCHPEVYVDLDDEVSRSTFQNSSGDTVCKTCRGDYYACDCPPLPSLQHLSMPDPEGTTRLAIIRQRLGGVSAV